MRILDRYVFNSVLGVFLTCLFTFLMLYIVIDIFSRLEDILKQKVAIEILIEYYLAYLPIIFVRVSPFACLLGTMYAFGKLNRENEIIAMRASGLSIIQITKTIIVFGIVVSLFTFWLNEKVVPLSQSVHQKFIELIDKGKKAQNEVINNLAFYGAKNRLIFANKFVPGENLMENIIILEHDEHQNLTKKIMANKAVYRPPDGWIFYQCITYEFDANGQIRNEPQYFDEELVNIPESKNDFLRQRQSPDMMTVSQLNNYLLKLSKSGASGVIRNLKVELYQRFTSPFMSFVIILLAIPFAMIIRKRAAGLSSVGFSILVGFLYYVLNAISLAFGKGGVLPPFLAASLSHILGIIFSFYLILKLP